MFHDVEIFIRVAEYQSFSKAARKLNLTPPAITRHIAKLEKELAVRLFQRNTRQVVLTEAGHIFYENCFKLMHDYQGAINQIKSLDNKINGKLKIGIPSSISHLFVASALKAFLLTYPFLSIEIVIGNHLIDLLSSGFDLIVHCGEIADNNFYSKKIGTWSRITCAAPEFLREFGLPATPYELSGYNCLDHLDNAGQVWSYKFSDGIKQISISGNVRANSSLDLKQLAIKGLGITNLPSFIVEDAINQNFLCPILVDYQLPPIGMYMVYPSKQYLNQKTKVFMEFFESLGITR
ncbi:MAG: putative transcriptional regulator, LysR family [Gammaproteobacteria bacterium]|jgi:DNA-binding transcriptional LysR family regulator|nr:putative transcriptional regulator, LysR family [Gammaproteobacteria bacterium]